MNTITPTPSLFAVGEVVRYAEIVDAGDATTLYDVIEERGDRVLIQARVDLPFRPTRIAPVSDLLLVDAPKPCAVCKAAIAVRIVGTDLSICEACIGNAVDVGGFPADRRYAVERYLREETQGRVKSPKNGGTFRSIGELAENLANVYLLKPGHVADLIVEAIAEAVEA